MTTYQLLVFVHVALAVIWVGGGFIANVLAVRMIRSGDDGAVATYAGAVEWVSLRVFAPASLLLVIVGFAMVGQSDAWALSQTWIWLSLVLYGVSFLTGAAFLGPQSGKLGVILEERGASDPEYRQRLSRILTVARFEQIALFAIIFLMVTKIGV